MSNQATADLDTNASYYDQGQADAGMDHEGGWEGRASDPGFATQPSDPPDEPSSAGPGRGEGADEQDEINSIEAYQQLLEATDIDALGDEPLDQEPAPVADPTAEHDPDEDPDHEEEATGRPPQVRLRPTSPLDARVFALMKADKSLDVATAIDLARASLGLNAPQADPDSTPDPGEADSTLDSASPVADIESQIRALRRDMIAAKRAYDADAEADLEEKILDLEEQLPALRRAEEARQRAEAEADSAWDTALKASWDSVVSDYPMAAEPDSAFALLVQKMDEDLERTGHPDYSDPNKARILAEKVAAKLGVRPVSAPPDFQRPLLAGGRFIPLVRPRLPSRAGGRVARLRVGPHRRRHPEFPRHGDPQHHDPGGLRSPQGPCAGERLTTTPSAGDRWLQL